jgi:hypothetical protein
MLLVACAACGGDAFGTAPDPAPDASPEATAPEAALADAPIPDADAGSVPVEDAAPEAAEEHDGGFTLHPPVDAGQPEAAQEPPEASAPETSTPPPVDAGCTPVTHSNGLGQHWTDCTPLGTYTIDEAMAACEAYGKGTCVAGNGACSDTVTPAVYSPSTYYAWAYSGTDAGQVGMISQSIYSQTCFPSGSAWR